MSFEEWHFNEFCKDNYDLESDQQKAIYCRIYSHAFEKSKKDAQEKAFIHQQAKIDELQARVDGVLKACNNLRTDLIRENHIEYDKGWKDCATSIYYQLKGKEDE